MKKLVQNLKLLVRNNFLLNYLIRGGFGFLPVTVKERLSNMISIPYSEVELDNDVIFVHVPKNAGNAIMQTLFSLKGQGHNKLCEYYAYDMHRFEQSFKFGVVRHPIDRFVSAFEYLKQGGMGLYDREFSEKYLLEYQSSEQLCCAMMKDKALEEKILSWTHFIPQSEFYEVNGESRVDYLICYKNISNGVLSVSAKLSLVLNEPLQRVNVTSRPKVIVKDIYVIKYLLELYAKDLKYYDSSK